MLKTFVLLGGLCLLVFYFRPSACRWAFERGKAMGSSLRDAPASRERPSRAGCTWVEDAEHAGLERAILEHTNRERALHGLPALEVDDQLAAVARGHSADMAARGYFDHRTPQGRTPSQRAEACGYNIRKRLGGGRFAVGVGENIQKMPTGVVLGIGQVDNDPESVARAQVRSWMKSPGHRRNILSRVYTRLGVGVAYDGTYYFSTQSFW